MRGRVSKGIVRTLAGGRGLVLFFATLSIYRAHAGSWHNTRAHLEHTDTRAHRVLGISGLCSPVPFLSNADIASPVASCTAQEVSINQNTNSGPPVLNHGARRWLLPWTVVCQPRADRQGRGAKSNDGGGGLREYFQRETPIILAAFVTLLAFVERLSHKVSNIRGGLTSAVHRPKDLAWMDPRLV